jgi:hypothetical protein
MSVSSAVTVSAMQELRGPFSIGDVAIADGYHIAGDGGGGVFEFDNLHIVSTQLQSATVKDASNQEPIEITTTGPHYFSPGQAVALSGVGSNTAANGLWIISDVTSTTFKLVGSQGNGGYTSDGFSDGLGMP